MKQNTHIPVLIQEVMDVLSPVEGDAYLDLTAGYGGHATEVLTAIGPEARAVLVDRDINAFKELTKKFAQDSNVEIIHNDYESSSYELLQKKQGFDCILADIGVSSPHLDNPDRGFSFMNEGPLDMRMDTSQELTAHDVINVWSREDLANVLYRYGEINSSYKIADIIIQNRPLSTTVHLASVIPGTFKTRQKMLSQVFQAIRIVVNDELGQLERSLPYWAKLLKPGGRLAVITFHSLEDRLVKLYFNEHGGRAFDADLKILTKRPLEASQNEIVFNPRSRSAKLRAVQRK